MCQLSKKGHQLTFWIGIQKSFSTPSKTYTLLPRTDTMSRLMDGKGVLIYVHKKKYYKESISWRVGSLKINQQDG